MKVAASAYRQRRKYGKPETCAVEPFDPGRQHIAVKAQRQNSETGSGHRWTAKEWHGNSIVHLLVGRQDQVRATAQRRDRTPRPLSFGINSPSSPRNRMIMRSSSGLLRAR